MSNEIKQSYYKKQLPNLIDKLKKMVEKNFAIISKVVECDVGSDKYYNVLKGRRMAAEDSVWGMKRISTLEKSINPEDDDSKKSYYKEMLPSLLDELKTMVTLNMDVIDIDIEEEGFDDNLKKLIEDDIVHIFGPEVSKRLFKKLNNSSITEDKYHNVLKARKMAALDCEWAMNKIDELENESNKKEEPKTNMSWSKRAAANKK